jgi:hypothetical protein
MLLLTGLSALASLVAPVAYAGQPNLLVVTEDADKEPVRPRSRIFTRVLRLLAEEMIQRGYTIVDEYAVSLNIKDPDRVRHRDAELIDIARAISIPHFLIDAIVVIQTSASAKKSLNSDVVRPEARISGRIINVRSSQLLADIEMVERDLPELPRGCDRECLLGEMGDWARPIARDLGSALAEKLANFRPGQP